MFLAAFVLLNHGLARADAPRLPRAVSAHNCYPSDSESNARVVEALALGIDNIEIDLGWDDRAKRLIVGHDAAPRQGVAYPTLEPYLVPALEAHWKSHQPAEGPGVLTVDWKTDRPEAVRAFKAFLDTHANWFSHAKKVKGKTSPIERGRITVCFTGSEKAKDLYDGMIAEGELYRAFRDRVHGQGAAFLEDPSQYAPTPATTYFRFLTLHWSAVEKGGPALAGEWTQADRDRLGSIVAAAHRQGFRVRIYCLNGHTGTLLSGYQFRGDEAAKARWSACKAAGVDWVATDEYKAIADAFGPAPELHLGPAPATTIPVAFRVVDLDAGESETVTFADGSKATVRLDSVKPRLDSLRDAVRGAEVKVTVNGQGITIDTGNYHLPKPVGGVQVDCPVISAYLANTTEDHWGLVKTARLRLWPKGSPWIEPGTFSYPARQKWFASMTQMGNEPTYVDGGEDPARKKVYYHSGLDIGGAEGLTEVQAATDALVVSSGLDRLPGHDDAPINVRYDVVYLLDGRGWYYRYSHMKTIDAHIKPGVRLKRGQLIGLLGKEGGSGGWSHLHFEPKARMPSGKWGTQEGYAFLWETAVREQNLNVIAVARPHIYKKMGEFIPYDFARSWSRDGEPTRGLPKQGVGLGGGTGVDTPMISATPGVPESFATAVEIRNQADERSYDFAVVQVVDPSRPLPPTIHAAYHPTQSLKPGQEITFKARTFRTGADGVVENWDFGDGRRDVTRSDGNARQHAPEGYASINHRYEKPGDYVVTVSRVSEHGFKATAKLWVKVR